ncbi:MAG: PD40 domain-containing protein [Verrucomicrobiales bacterium]|nr:PD40 domain-containing protein [Verrucomicrobiales bacterium]
MTRSPHRADRNSQGAFAKGDLVALMAVFSLVPLLAGPTTPSRTAAGNSGGAVVSGNGRYLTFVSEADDLVADGHNGPITDVYVRDLERKETLLISASLGGNDGGNGSSRSPSISDDGRWVAFESAASNLVEGDTNGRLDVFLQDRTTGVMRRLSTPKEDSSGAAPNLGDSRNAVVTAEGQWVFFDSENALVADDTNHQRDVYRYRISTGELDWVSRAPDGPNQPLADSMVPVVDPTGRRLAYRRLPLNSPSGIPTEGSDLVILDLATGTGSYLKSPVRGNADQYRFSDDGHTLVAGLATSGGKHVVVAADLEAGSTTLVDAGSVAQGRVSLNSFALTADGRRVVLGWSSEPSIGGFRIPTNSVWVWTPGGTPAPISIRSNALRSGSFDLSPDGEWIAFRLDLSLPGSEGEGLDAGAVYVRRLESGPLTRVSADASSPQFLPDGTRVLVETGDSHLVPGDQNDAVDLVLRDLTTESVELVSAAVPREEPEVADAQLGPDPCLITADGQKVFFVSYSESLIPGDTNRSSDIFMRDLSTGALELISVAADGSGPGNRASFHPVITPDGMSVAFLSLATNLTAGEFQDTLEVFHRDRATRTTRRVSEGPELPAQRAAMNPGISRDGKRVLFEVYEKNQAFVWQVRSDGAPELIPVQGIRSGASRDRVTQCRLSANGARVAFRNPSFQAASVLDLAEDRYFRLGYPGPAAPYRNFGIAINSTGTQCITETQFDAGQPIQAVWQSDQGSSRLIEVHHPSDTGWMLREIREIAFSPDDRYVVFTRRMVSTEPPQLAQRSDVFLHDLQTGATTLISVNRHGTGPGNGFSRGPSVSSGGRRVAFRSDATDLVADDTNGRQDVFVRDLDVGVTRRVMASESESRSAHGPTLAANTNRIVFHVLNAPREVSRRAGVGSAATRTVVGSDADLDGLDDDWERAFFGSTLGGADEDSDGDGRTSLEEIIAGTLPDSPASLLRLRLRADPFGRVQVEWDSVFGRHYELVRRVGSLDQPPQVIRTLDGTGIPVTLEELLPADETVTLYGVRVSQSPFP